jgi:small subunit ribosomal protein S2
VTTVALIDTDSDPDTVDLPIPGNDDSIRSIELVLAKLADAVLEGQQMLTEGGASAEEPAPEEKSGATETAATGETTTETASGEASPVAAENAPQPLTESAPAAAVNIDPAATVMQEEPENESAEVVAAS